MHINVRMQISWPQPNEQWLVVVFGAKAKKWDPENCGFGLGSVCANSTCLIYAAARTLRFITSTSRRSVNTMEAEVIKLLLVGDERCGKTTFLSWVFSL